jgi:hypothetical protein
MREVEWSRRRRQRRPTRVDLAELEWEQRRTEWQPARRATPLLKDQRAPVSLTSVSNQPADQITLKITYTTQPDAAEIRRLRSVSRRPQSRTGC